MRPMAFGLALLSLLLAAAGQGLAQSSVEKPSDDVHFGKIADPAIWPISSVGKVTVMWGRAMFTWCTGTMVAPKVVLTAAHCLFRGGNIANPNTVHFLAGIDKGVPNAHSIAERLEVSSHYQTSSMAAGADWALIFLKDDLHLEAVEVRRPSVEDIQKISSAKSAMQVGYGRDRPYLPSIVRNCEIDESSTASTFLYRCLANFGYSGAPIISDFDGRPTIIGIGSRGGKPDVDNPLGVACSAAEFADRIGQLSGQK